MHGAKCSAVLPMKKSTDWLHNTNFSPRFYVLPIFQISMIFFRQIWKQCLERKRFADFVYFLKSLNSLVALRN